MFVYSDIPHTAPFNNLQTLKFKAQPRNAFFATINQMFGGSFQLPTMLSELCSAMLFDNRAQSVLVGSWEEPPNNRLMVPHVIEWCASNMPTDR